MKKCSLLLWLCVGALSGCLGVDKTTGVSGYGMITGQLTDSEGQVFAGAKVHIKGDLSNVAITDADGAFTLSNIEVGQHKVIAFTANGFGGISDVVVYSNKTSQVQIMLGPTGTIKGTANLEDAEDHVGITAYLLGTSFVSITDHDGNYRIFFIVPDCYDLRLEKEGYHPHEIQNVCVGLGDELEMTAVTLYPGYEHLCGNDDECEPNMACIDEVCQLREEFDQEHCDGFDNDGDGQVDEGLATLCGSDIGQCEFGMQHCFGGVWTECEGQILPMDEECGDHLDNNCNEEIDEGCFDMPCSLEEELCPFGQVCDLDVCGPQMMGMCVDQPEFCPDLYEPVCGCDDVTYINDCERLMVGMPRAHEGECDEPICEFDEQCDDGNGCTEDNCINLECVHSEFPDCQWCETDADHDGFFAECEPELTDCNDEDPTIHPEAEELCDDEEDNNCNGITNENCEELCGGISSVGCEEGQVCDLAGCEPIVNGYCVPQPEECTEEYDPVCGCDGQTYSNNCERLSIGVALAHAGDCSGECIMEGQNLIVDEENPNQPTCCEGLTAIEASYLGEEGECLYDDCLCFICSDCGNSQCDPWENECNCPADCNPDACTSSSDCDDEDACTIDSCTNGLCTHTEFPACTWCKEDLDGDGFFSACYPEQADCNDADPEVHPGVLDVCDAQDNDCDGELDEDCFEGCVVDSDCEDGDECTDDYCEAEICHHKKVPGCDWCVIDEDGDGFFINCFPADTDCDDSNPDVNPKAVEFCDGLDNNCNADVDEECEHECGGIAGKPCDEGLICDLISCSPDAGGHCIPAPEACDEDQAPVCGCDGETYPNDCHRIMAGVPLSHEGECGGECVAEGEQYDWDPENPGNQCCDGLQPLDLAEESNGECIPLPCACSICTDCGNGICEEWENLCNCPVDCELQPCEIDEECFDDQICTEDICEAGNCMYFPVPGCEWCDTDEDGDGFFMNCIPEETDCDDGNPEVHPGAEELCDGLDNDCDGDVDEECQSQCGGIAGIPCEDGAVCNLHECFPDAMGECVPMPEGCDELYEPVCGCDGQTYANDCERIVAGMPLDSEGECGTGCQNNEECGDDDDCTLDECVNSECIHTGIPGCGWCDIDEDNDGYFTMCDLGFIDCDDQDPEVHPWAEELLDGKDNDCNDAVDDLNPEPGDFAWPCAENTDCISGYCIELLPEYDVCTITCVDECPAGLECISHGLGNEGQPVHLCK